MKIFSAIFVIVLLLILGNYKPKFGIAIAGLILLGAIAINNQNFVNLMKGEVK